MYNKIIIDDILIFCGFGVLESESACLATFGALIKSNSARENVLITNEAVALWAPQLAVGFTVNYFHLVLA